MFDILLFIPLFQVITVMKKGPFRRNQLYVIKPEVNSILLVFICFRWKFQLENLSRLWIWNMFFLHWGRFTFFTGANFDKIKIYANFYAV